MGLHNSVLLQPSLSQQSVGLHNSVLLQLSLSQQSVGLHNSFHSHHYPNYLWFVCVILSFHSHPYPKHLWVCLCNCLFTAVLIPNICGFVCVILSFHSSPYPKHLWVCLSNSVFSQPSLSQPSVGLCQCFVQDVILQLWWHDMLATGRRVSMLHFVPSALSFLHVLKRNLEWWHHSAPPPPPPNLDSVH